MAKRRATVHVCGPWETEYQADGTQRRTQRCLHCETLLAAHRDFMAREDDEGYALGQNVGIYLVGGESKSYVLDGRARAPEEMSCRG